MIARLYSWLFTALMPLVFLRLWWRGRHQPLYREHWAERLAYYPEHFGTGARVFWVHAVSLGETRAVAPLIEALRRRFPGAHLLLTHMTPTGREAGRALLRPGDCQVWLPFDLPGATQRFLRRFRPVFGVLMETELWPNLLHGCRALDVPLFLVNARISPGSFARMRWLSLLSRDVFAQVRGIAAQTELDAQRLVQLSGRRVPVFGNLKFDVTPDARLVELGQRWRAAQARPVLGLLSAREGEEALLLQAWQRVPAERRARVLLLIVPRHPERFEAVEQAITAQGLRVVRRSTWDAPRTLAADAVDVVLGDTMGEMPFYAALSSLAFMGGGWLPHGGQNLIEVCACGCPVLLGTHMFNFAEASRHALAAGAAHTAANLDEAVERALALLLDETPPKALRQMQQAARQFAFAHQGATVKTANWIVSQL